MLTVKTTRNQSMELAKLIASFFVICIHFWFPGDFGFFVEALARFAVPMFFLITGYFNYSATGEQVFRRLKNILKLYLVAAALYFLWGGILTEIERVSTKEYVFGFFNAYKLVQWLIMQEDPFSVHLWYLDALIIVYGLYWLYIRFWGKEKVNYQPLYIAGFCLFCVYFRFSVLTNAAAGEGQRSVNAWFTGIPMFALGIFLHEYQQRIFENFALTTKKLWALLLAGVALVILQGYAGNLTVLPFGALLILGGVILLAISHPQISGSSRFWAWFFAHCGTWATWVYILHPMVRSAYKHFVRPTVFALITEDVERAIHPLIIFVLCLLIGMAIDTAAGKWKKQKKA